MDEKKLMNRTRHPQLTWNQRLFSYDQADPSSLSRTCDTYITKLLVSSCIQCSFSHPASVKIADLVQLQSRIIFHANKDFSGDISSMHTK